MKNNSKIYWYGLSSEPLSESDGNGNFTDDYVFFGGNRVAHHTRTPNHLYYYLQDHLGTSRMMVTSTGTVCYDADFSPFGGELVVTSSCAQNYRFTGKERDPETGNDDFGARSYSSNFGRFMSADWSAVPVPVPYANLSNPQTLNLYAMARDNPMTFADLDGHRTNDAWDDTTGETGVDAIGAGGTDPTGGGDDNGAQAGGTGSSAAGGAGAPANTQPTQNNAGQSQSTQQLINAQDAARQDPALQPSDDGNTTHCNQATLDIAKAMNAPLAELTDKKGGAISANGMSKRLAESENWTNVTERDAQSLANSGKLVIGVQPNGHGHGHIATVRPNSNNPGDDPTINNVGRSVGIMPASKAFSSARDPASYYTPVPEN